MASQVSPIHFPYHNVNKPVLIVSNLPRAKFSQQHTVQSRGRLSRRPLQKQGGTAGGRYSYRKRAAAVTGGRLRNNALGQDAPTPMPWLLPKHSKFKIYATPIPGPASAAAVWGLQKRNRRMGAAVPQGNSYSFVRKMRITPLTFMAKPARINIPVR